MKRTVAFGLLVLLAAVAMGFRLPRLDHRPMHTDEAVHALKFQELIERGRYVYDPHDYHGPTLIYLTAPSMWLSGAKGFADTTEKTYRIVPALFGAALVLLLLPLLDGLGRAAALFAGLLTAVSPAMVFYSRYYIMEMLLVFFTTALIVAGWRYSRSRRTTWLLLAGLAAGFMYATKETCVLAWAAMAVGLLTARPWVKNRPPAAEPFPSPVEISEARHATAPAPAEGTGELPAKHLAMAILIAAAAASLLLTNFLRNPRAIADSVATYWSYFVRGQSGHNAPWYEHLATLAYFRQGDGPVWTEALILALAATGCVAAIAGKGLGKTNVKLARFLAAYAVALTAAYCAIPYKTPWCALGFLHGMILLVRAMPSTTMKVAAVALLAAGAIHLGRQAHAAAFAYDADVRNPYVYAQTSPDILRLVEQVERVAAVHPQGKDMPIQVVAPDDDYWPLPWCFRRFARVGYYSAVPRELEAPVIIASPACEGRLRSSIRAVYAGTGYYELRPGALLGLFVRGRLWEQAQPPIDATADSRAATQASSSAEGDTIPNAE